MMVRKREERKMGREREREREPKIKNKMAPLIPKISETILRSYSKQRNTYSRKSTTPWYEQQESVLPGPQPSPSSG